DQTNFNINNNPNANFLFPNTYQATPQKGAVSSSSTTNTNSQAYYIQDKVAVTDWLDLLGGFRIDRFSAQFRNNVNSGNLNSVDRIPSGRAAAIVKPTEEQSYYFNWGTSANPSAENFTLANNTA